MLPKSVSKKVPIYLYAYTGVHDQIIGLWTQLKARRTANRTLISLIGNCIRKGANISLNRNQQIVDDPHANRVPIRLQLDEEGDRLILDFWEKIAPGSRSGVFLLMIEQALKDGDGQVHLTASSFFQNGGEEVVIRGNDLSQQNSGVEATDELDFGPDRFSGESTLGPTLGDAFKSG